MIKKVKLQNFKNITNFETGLDKINILIGSNNSGKSSVLQGVHFSIMAEVVRRRKQVKNVPEDELLYLPSSDFIKLRHDKPYTVSSGLTSNLYIENDNDEFFEITIAKGRNAHNVSVMCERNNSFRQNVTSFNPLYSMYVPGISGIPIREKYVTEAELRSAVARGDANMYIRNILYQLSEEDKLKDLNEFLQIVFPEMEVLVPYNPEEDIYLVVDLNLSLENGDKITVPLEQCGTGTLQILQIMAYVLYFSPKLLLLDEPDEHLHPDNQGILARVLEYMVEDENLQIILCTHSRALLNSFSIEPQIIWMTNGNIKESGTDIDKYDILMDIGALDVFDRCLSGKYDVIVMTEDRNTNMIRLLLEKSGCNNYYIFSYKSSSKLEVVSMLSSFIHQYNPTCEIIIHRDSDFLLQNEMDYYKELYEEEHVHLFFTDGSDMESYYTNIDHVAELLDVKPLAVRAWIESIIESNAVEIGIDYSNLRNGYMNLRIYKKVEPEKWIPAKDLLKEGIQLKHVKGKYLLKQMYKTMFDQFGKEVNLITSSSALEAPELKRLIKKYVSN